MTPTRISWAAALATAEPWTTQEKVGAFASAALLTGMLLWWALFGRKPPRR